MHKLRILFCLVWSVGLLAAAGCSRSSGTYVVLDFGGTVSNLAPVHSIAVDLDMGGQKASTLFTAPGGGDITLSTTATLKIQHGSGDLLVTATAKSADGRVLGIGTGLGTVVAGQTTHITVSFGSDAGVVGGRDAAMDSAGDAVTDALAEQTRPDGNGGVDGAADGSAGRGGADGPSVVDGAAGSDGPGGAGGAAGTGGTAGSGGAGGRTQDAGPDAPSGGSGGAGGTGGGTGIVKIVSLPSTLAFGNVPVNSTSPTMTTLIQNVGNIPTPALSVKAPPATSSFAIQADFCSGRTLAPNDSCTILMIFSPTALGPMSAVLSVTAASFSGTDIALTGTGTGGPPPMLTIQPAQALFGVVDVGGTSSVTFTVSNTGGSLSSTLLVSNTGGPVFQLTGDQCSNRVLAANTSCTFAVTFAPTTVGPANGSVTVRSPDGTTSLTATFTGTGRDYVTLTVRLAGNGNGTVVASGLTCQAGICTGQYPRTDPTNPPSVTLIAKPDPSSTFGGWLGSGCAAASTCTVVLGSSTTLTATFNAIPVTPLTVQVGLNVFGLAGHTGSLQSTDNMLSCSGSCAPVPYPAGGTVTLNAVAGAGSTFIGWTEGPCRGASPQCVFTTTSDIVVSATFGPQAYMFVTSTNVVPGKLSGVAGADAVCMNRATGAGLPGTYRAWLSSSTVAANSRVGNGGWVRVDGRPFGRNIATLGVLANQVVYYPPRINELGNDVGPGHVLVATGGNQDGSTFGSQCADYTTTTGDLYVGDAIAGSGYWAYNQLIPNGCSSLLPLYCFRTDLTGDLKPAPLLGRHVFVTAAGWTPFGNIKNADAFCRADATAAGLANASAFVALLATSTASAASRLTTGGAPWKRVDDVFVFNSPNDLGASKLLAPFGLVADGSLYSNFTFWSGAGNPGAVSSGDVSCQDWSTSASTAHGLYGNAILSGGPDWFSSAPNTDSCDQAGVHLLCAEP